MAYREQIERDSRTTSDPSEPSSPSGLCPIDFGNGRSGVATGRAVRERKRRIDETHRIDLTDLRRAGALDLEPGHRCSSRWGPHGWACRSEVFFALLGDDGDPARACALVHDEPGAASFARYGVLLVPTPCYFGGRRWWFLCPGPSDEQPCGRRCRILHRPADAARFACRECHRLSYESRQRHRERRFEFVRALDVVLGELSRTFPRRPDVRTESRRLRRFQRASAILGVPSAPCAVPR